MNTITAQKRDLNTKAKKLRREGFVPGNLFGHEMKESQALQFSAKEAEHFMKTCKKGSEVTLDIDGKKIDALLKDLSYNSMLKHVEFLDFQALVAGEKVTSVAQIVLANADEETGHAQLEIEELQYKADPAHLIEKVEIDLSKFAKGQNIYVRDLDICKDTNLHIITPMDTMIVNETERMGMAEPVEEEATAATEAQ